MWVMSAWRRFWSVALIRPFFKSLCLFFFFLRTFLCLV